MSNTATVAELTEEQKAENFGKMFPEFELPKPLKQTADNLHKLIAEALAKSDDSIVKALKQIKEYVSTLNGDGEKKKRINHMAALLRVDPTRLKEGKSTVARLEIAMNALLEKRDPRHEIQLHAAVSVDKEAKPKEAGELEKYLTSAEMATIEVSGAISNLTAEDIKNVTSAVFAAYNAALAWLTQKIKMPSAAEKALQWLLGAASGQTEFEATNEFIAATANVSTKQVSRNIQALSQFMTESKLGLVDITQAVKKPTKYRLQLLDVMQALIQNIMVGEGVTARNTLAIAGASGKLLTENATAASLQMDEESFNTARALAQNIEATLNDFPKPTVKLQEGGIESKKASAMKQIVNLRTVAGELGEKASEAGLSTEDQNAIGQIALALRSVESKVEAGKPADLDPIRETIKLYQSKVKEALSSETENAAKELNEAKADGRTTPELFQSVAMKQVAEYPESDLTDILEQSFQNVESEIYEQAAICARLENDAKAKQVVRLHNLIKSAFGTIA